MESQGIWDSGNWEACPGVWGGRDRGEGRTQRIAQASRARRDEESATLMEKQQS